MFEQLRFYIAHTLNDLRVNRRLTFFALLSIAAGVAAIVSLQTLSVMIGDTLEQNLQETNRGDVSINLMFSGDDAPRRMRDRDSESDTDEPLTDEEIAVQTALESGWLMEDEMSFFGQSMNEYAVTLDGLDALQAWIDANYPDQATFTYKQKMLNVLQLLFGSGIGTAITDVETGEQSVQLSPVVIDPTVYPYYSEVLTQAGEPLSAVLTSATDIVIGDTTARDLELAVGDVVQLNGAAGDFTVRGIVDMEVEIKNPAEDLFTGIFGFYYLSFDAVELFEDVAPRTQSIYIKLSDPTLVMEFDEALRAEFPYFETTTTEDIREFNEQLVEQIDQLMTIMGMVSVLLGSIGIVNTMQVVVRRRMMEIAVLKTIGLQGNQITLLFLTQALIMGILGAIIGIVLGWVGTFAIKGVAEAIFTTSIPFRIALMPVVNGFVVGVVVATVFGFLPTLSAGQIRPSIILRPAESMIPRTGCLPTLAALASIAIILSFVLQGISGSSFGVSLAIVVGTFIAAGVIYGLLWVLIFIVGYVLLLIGLVDVQVSMRQMLATRRRGASTLLALVVGVFSLSLITLFAESINNILTTAFESAGGNVLVTAQNYNQLDGIQTMLDGLDGVESYTTSLAYQGELVSFEDVDTGTVYTAEEFLDSLPERNLNFPPLFNGDAEERLYFQEEMVDGLVLTTTIEAVDVTDERNPTMAAGRSLTAADADQPVLVMQENPFLTALGFTVGDRLTYRVTSGNLFSQQSGEVTFELVGFESPTISMSTGGTTYAPAAVFPENVDPSAVAIMVDIEEENIADLRRELASFTGVFAIETSVFTRIIEAMLGIFTAFPTLVAMLGLVVGGVVIANSVALTTMERRREIAVMKSVGLQRPRVLGMLLLENGILGFIGGLMGVGYGLIGMVIFAQASEVPLDTIPFGIAFALMGLCIVIALVAALTSAWSAASEKPLNVLRYE